MLRYQFKLKELMILYLNMSRSRYGLKLVYFKIVSTQLEEIPMISQTFKTIKLKIAISLLIEIIIKSYKQVKPTEAELIYFGGNILIMEED